MKFPHLFRPKEEAPVFLASPLEATNLKFPHLFRPKEEAPVFLASPLEATNHEISSSFQAWRRSSSLFSISPWSCVQRLQSGASLWGTSLIVSLLLFLSYFSFVVAFGLLVFIERGVDGGRGRVHSKKAYGFLWRLASWASNQNSGETIQIWHCSDLWTRTILLYVHRNKVAY